MTVWFGFECVIVLLLRAIDVGAASRRAEGTV
jgi:hypothetical protein